jgi:hypothetical protein
MAGIGIAGGRVADDAALESAVAEFVPKVLDLFAAQDHLRNWRNRKVRSNLRLLNVSSDMPLPDYLRALRKRYDGGDQSLDRKHTFGELLQFFS